MARAPLYAAGLAGAATLLGMKMRTERQGASGRITMLLLAAVLPFADAIVARADTANNIDKPGWKLTFHDEFDGAQLDATKWDDHYWHGRTHSNNELEYYAPDGYEVGDGR